EMAMENARQGYEEKARSQKSQLEALTRLQSRLRLPRLPRRIECFDISTFQGQLTVGSQVVFADGEPDKSGYRLFKVRGEAAGDDFACMFEVLTRWLKRGIQEQNLPDLLVVDGGKGQLNLAPAALRVAVLTLQDVALAGLAKTGLPQDGDGRRDEAHRVAITFHRKLRRERNFRSMLEEIPGIGDKRKRGLLSHFGSLRRIRAASAEEIAEVEGFNLQLAERVQRFLTAQSAEAEAHEAAEGGAELDGGAPAEAGPGNGTLLRDRDDVAFDAAAAELDAIEEEEAPPPEPIDAETPPSN